MIRSAAKNFHDVAVVTSPARLRRRRRRNVPLRRNAFADQPSGVLLKKPSPPLPPTMPRSPPLSSASSPNGNLQVQPESSTFSAHLCASLPEEVSTCGTAKTLIRRPPCIPMARRSASPMPAAARQGTLLQQHRRPAGRLGSGPGIRRTRLRHHQAHESRAEPRPAKTLVEAYKQALECDPVSAFGGVIGVNRPIDAETAEEMHKAFSRSDRRALLRPGRPSEVRVEEKPPPGRS